MEGINISINEVKSIAGEIRRLNDNLSNQLREIMNDMNSLEASWQSQASLTVREGVKAMEPKLANYTQIVESYAAFLDRTVADQYSSLEQRINNEAQQFK